MDVFVYGTLTDSGTAASVLSTVEYRGEARLSGLHRVDGEYPTLAPGGSVRGRILATDELDRLDSGIEHGCALRDISDPTVERQVVTAGPSPDEYTTVVVLAVYGESESLL